MGLEILTQGRFREVEAYVESHKDNKILLRILSGESTFYGEVSDFYDSEGRGSSSMKEETPNKKGQVPYELIRLLNTSRADDSGDLNPANLVYEKVRETYKKFNFQTERGDALYITSGFLALPLSVWFAADYIATTSDSVSFIDEKGLAAMGLSLGFAALSILGMYAGYKLWQNADDMLKRDGIESIHIYKKASEADKLTKAYKHMKSLGW